MNHEVTEEVCRKVVEVVDQGLCKGKGVPVPGQMCVEAAVCYAFNLPHSDKPPCVGSAVRSYKIRLNDANWSSNEARAKGMRRVAVAQLGSDAIDQKAFAEEVILQGIRQILPIALRAAASVIPRHAAALELAAVGCEAALTFVQAKGAAQSARVAAAAAAAYAYAAADAAAAAAADAARRQKRDAILAQAAEIGVQALIKLGAKGASYLWLCGE